MIIIARLRTLHSSNQL